MAYLSQNAEDEQTDQSSKQDSNADFNIYSSASGMDAGDNQPASSNQSANQAQQNAQSYTKTFSGGDTDTSSSPQQPTGGSSNANQQANQTGYINFQNYQNASPSEASNISNAGNQVIGGEKQNFETAQNNFNNYKAPTPLGDQTTADNTVYGMLSSSSYDPTQLQSWMNGSTAGLPTGIDYTPGANYQQNSAELSQTPIMGGSTQPSVNDYLAQNEIQAGNYSLGNRNLDNSLIAGDVGAQQAIAGNAKAASDLNNEISTGETNAANTAATWAPIIQANQGLVNTALGDISGNVNTEVGNAVKAANAGLDPASQAAATQAIQNYFSWYNNPANAGQLWQGSITPQGQATTQNTITPEQATVLNRIAQLNGATEPYDPTKVGGGPAAETISGQGETGPGPENIDWTSTDPGDVAIPGAPAPVPTIQKYLNISGASYPYTAAHPEQQNYSPAEQAVAVAMNGTNSQYFKPTPQDYQTAASQLEGILASEPANYPYRNDLQKELNAVESKIQGFNQDPYAYGMSLGLSPDQLWAMGITPPGSKLLGIGQQQPTSFLPSQTPVTTLPNPLNRR